jgi:3-hydroxyisobutyrate dehydrogenase-like beta-hydroxyacid dehydrogenase
MATRIAVLGTGRMGSALVRRFAAAGFELILWDRTAERARALGVGHVAATPAEAVAEAEFVVSSLTGPDALRATYLGPRGALETAHGQLFLEMSTAGPDFETELAPHVASKGARLIDAPIVGAPPIVERGEAVILAGGKAADFERARPILEPLGTVRHVGPLGNGARLKLIANSMLAQIVAGAGELQNAGILAGLDPDDVFWLLVRFAPTLETRRPAFVDNELQPTMFALHDLRKDLDLALGVFHAEDAPAPMTAIARELVSQALGEFSDNDIGAMVRLYRRSPRQKALDRVSDEPRP